MTNTRMNTMQAVETERLMLSAALRMALNHIMQQLKEVE